MEGSFLSRPYFQDAPDQVGFKKRLVEAAVARQVMINQEHRVIGEREQTLGDLIFTN